MSWFDEVKEIVAMGAEAHRERDWVGIVFFWIFAVFTTGLLAWLGIGVYLWLA